MTDDPTTDLKRQAFIVELRRLAPLFEKSGVSDCFTQAADEIERLAKENVLLTQALINERLDLVEKDLEALRRM